MKHAGAVVDVVFDVVVVVEVLVDEEVEDDIVIDVVVVVVVDEVVVVVDVVVKVVVVVVVPHISMEDVPSPDAPTLNILPSSKATEGPLVPSPVSPVLPQEVQFPML